eukprot:g22733.t1
MACKKEVGLDTQTFHRLTSHRNSVMYGYLAGFKLTSHKNSVIYGYLAGFILHPFSPVSSPSRWLCFVNMKSGVIAAALAGTVITTGTLLVWAVPDIDTMAASALHLSGRSQTYNLLVTDDQMGQVRKAGMTPVLGIDAHIVGI